MVNNPDQCKISKIQKLIAYHSAQLFKEHTNLNMISGCHLRSRNEGRSIESEHFVVLFCYSKGIVPIGEKEFPKKLALHNEDEEIEFPVDVREGYFEPCHGNRTYDFNNPLRMGGSFGIKGDLRSATIGPFVELPHAKTKIGFLTAGHACSGPCLSTVIVQPSENDTFDSAMKNTECGRLLRIHPDHMGIDMETGVSAALIEITHRPPESGLFAITEKSQLSRAGFDGLEWPTFNTGKIETVEDNLGRMVLKFGSRSGLTTGFLMMEAMALRVVDDDNDFKNLFEISSRDISPFCIPGDSGSAVFFKDDNNELTCIGIVLGMTSHMTALVSPIKNILDTFGLNLKKFHE